MRMVVACLLFWAAAAGVWGEDFVFSADAGAAPTTMGTVGQYLRLQGLYGSFFQVELTGNSEKKLIQNQPLNLFGARAQGDQGRDSLSGLGRTTFQWNLLEMWIALAAGGQVDYSTGSTLARVLEPGLGLPADTTRFMDISLVEWTKEAFLGASVGWTTGVFGFRVSYNYSPLVWWTQSSDRLLTGLVWPLEYPTGITYPTFYWSERKEELDLRARRSQGDFHLHWDASPVGFFGFGAWEQRVFSGVTDISIRGTLAYKEGDGATPVSNLPWKFVRSNLVLAAALDLSQSRIEAGAGLRLWFLKDLAGLNYPPEIRISYSLSQRKYLYDYLEDRPELTQETWTEDYGYVSFRITLGLASP